jgi:hypothetical protein
MAAIALIGEHGPDLGLEKVRGAGRDALGQQDRE